MEENKAVEKEQNTIELDYPQVSIGRHLACNFADFFFWLVSSLLLFILANFIVENNKSVNTWKEENTAIRLESGLYLNDEGLIENVYNYYYDSTELTIDEKSEKIDSAMLFFFTEYLPGRGEDAHGKDGKEVYLDLKKAVTYEEERLFDDSGERIILSDDYDTVYLEAYRDLLEGKAIGYLDLIDGFKTNRQMIDMAYLLAVAFTVSTAYLLIYYLIPLCFRRGKRTLGMLVTKTSLLAVDGFSCRLLRFTIRFLFNFILIFWGSILAFLIPLLISITMIFLSKSHQSLTDYVVNTYLVMSDDQNVYLNLNEYLAVGKEKNRPSLYDGDIKIHYDKNDK